jgi:hypothetical protein
LRINKSISGPGLAMAIRVMPESNAYFSITLSSRIKTWLAEPDLNLSILAFSPDCGKLVCSDKGLPELLQKAVA